MDSHFDDSKDKKCPKCGEKAFVDGTYGTAEVPGWMYPLGYKLCLNCGYDEYPEEKKEEEQKEGV